MDKFLNQTITMSELLDMFGFSPVCVRCNTSEFVEVKDADGDYIALPADLTPKGLIKRHIETVREEAEEKGRKDQVSKINALLKY